MVMDGSDYKGTRA